MKKQVMTAGQFNCLVIISALFLGTTICSEVLLHKMVAIGGAVISAGSLVAPVWFVLNDIITELYGYAASKRMYFCVISVFFIFCVVSVLLIHLPSPTDWKGGPAYQFVIGELIRQFFGALVGISVGGIINMLLLARWKILLRGRYFWLRSIGASAVGEVLFTSIAFSIVMLGSPNSIHLASLIVWGICLKISGNLVLAFPANMVVNYLKKTGLTDIFQNEPDFNPFKNSESKAK